MNYIYIPIEIKSEKYLPKETGIYFVIYEDGTEGECSYYKHIKHWHEKPVKAWLKKVPITEMDAIGFQKWLHENKYDWCAKTSKNYGKLFKWFDSEKGTFTLEQLYKEYLNQKG